MERVPSIFELIEQILTHVMEWTANQEETSLDYISKAALLITCFYLLILFVKRSTFNFLKRLAAGTETKADDKILELIEGETRHTTMYFLMSMYLAVKMSDIQLPKWDTYLWPLFLTIVTWRAVQVGQGLLATILTEFTDFKDHEYRATTLMKAVRIVLVSMGFVFVVENSGMRVNSLMAGVSISGAILALSSQTLLQDLFAFFAIIFDTPYVVGDAISVGGGEKGIVETVGLRTTRVRNLNGELQVFANKDISNTRISNFSRMPFHRAVLKLELGPQTKSTQITAFLKSAEAIVQKHEGLKFCAARFSAFTQWGFEVTIVYRFEGEITTPAFMDMQHLVNASMLIELEQQNIDLAGKARFEACGMHPGTAHDVSVKQ